MTYALLGPSGIRTAMSAIAAGGGMAGLPARLLDYPEWMNAGVELTDRLSRRMSAGHRIQPGHRR